MKTLLGCLAAVLVAGSAARADEMDRETKSKPAVVAAMTTAAPALAGSELDKESPDQSHGWRRGGWGVSVGFGGGWGGYGGYSVGYYGGYRPWGGYGYSVGYYPRSYYYPVSYYRPYHAHYYYGGCW